MLDSGGGLAMDAYGLRVTYVNIIQVSSLGAPFEIERDAQLAPIVLISRRPNARTHTRTHTSQVTVWTTTIVACILLNV